MSIINIAQICIPAFFSFLAGLFTFLIIDECRTNRMLRKAYCASVDAMRNQDLVILMYKQALAEYSEYFEKLKGEKDERSPK